MHAVWMLVFHQKNPKVIEVINMFDSNCLISCSYVVNMAVIDISTVRYDFTFTDIDF